ncbi:S-formylglutathione hydrolase [Basfia succiniciproducens]|uniref:S-formylglutathione hydrolase n=1 Tax=Basfia succiniciproducens TaxID=653940 RepID=UPI003FCDAD75
MKQLENVRTFGGEQQVWQHQSATLNCTMNFAIFLPEQAKTEKLPVLYWLSGLTCTEQNFITKAGAQRYAAQHKVIIVAPDTSPRGDDVVDNESYDLGKGAGFYLNATQQPWAKHYQMYDYIVNELPALIAEHFPVNGKQAISGHSMGGHGALTIALKNPQRYSSVSAFAPIVAPTQVPWGQKAFQHYLGDNQTQWTQYDATALVNAETRLPIRIDQGDKDSFLAEQLRPELFLDACRAHHVACEYYLRQGYDHSYYFIATFIGEHIAFHAKALYQDPRTA